MADDGSPESLGSVPEPIREWLAELAADRDLSEAEVVRRLLAGDGDVAEWLAGEATDPVDARIEALESTVDGIEADLEALESSLEAAVESLDADFGDKLRDVRERVIQVKRETDEKADLEHGHAALAGRVETVEEELEALRAEVGTLEDRVRARVDSIEAATDRFADRAEEFAEKLDTLASAVVTIKRLTESVSQRDTRQQSLTELTEAANRQGIGTAACASCGERVDIGLLTTPRCPACREAFTGLDPAQRRFFGRHVLRTGERPALEGEVATPAVEDLLAADADRDGDRHAEAEDPPDRAGGVGPFEAIDGVGATYADRLRAAGIESVRTLALAEPGAVADAIGVSATRTARWVEQARALDDADD